MLWISAPAKPNIWGSPAWQGGHYEVQDAGSQLVASAALGGAGEASLALAVAMTINPHP